MPDPTILITGATGQTGRAAVEQLIERGQPVRALVHRLDDRSDALVRLGAEVVQGDLLDVASLRPAMAGIRRAYLCLPFSDRLVEATANLILVAKEGVLDYVVDMSQIEVRDNHPSQSANQHWLSERLLEWAGIGVTHLRPSFFAENWPRLTAAGIAQDGKMYLPLGNGRHAAVTAADIARVAVACLLDPEPHLGQAYTVTGGQALSLAEMAATVGRVLGKPVEYVDIPYAAFAEGLRASGMPETLVQHLEHITQDHKDGYFAAVTDVVERVGGRPPQSWEAFVRDNAAAFVGA